MKLEGSYTFNAPRDVVWKALMDPEILARVMPGCEKLEEVAENEYTGALKIKVGPVQGLFQGKVTLTDINAPDSYNMQVDGKGQPGFMKGEGHVELEEQDGATVMHYSGEAQVGGRIASVGQRLLDSSAKAITRQSLEGLNQQIEALANPAPADDDAPAASPPPPSAPSQVEFATGVAKEMLDDFLPADKRPMLITAGVGVMVAFFILNIIGNWWANMVANRVIDRLDERR